MRADLMRMGSLVAVAAALAIALSLNGCAPGGASIEDRVDGFVADLDAGRYDVLYKHLHEDCSLRNAAKAPDYWNVTPFVAVDNPRISDLHYGEITTGTFTSDATGPAGEPITFEMLEQEPNDWYIRRISIPGQSYLLE